METKATEKMIAAANDNNGAAKKIQHKSNIPTTDINTAALAVRVGAKLADYPDIVLPYMSLSVFQTKADTLLNLVQTRADEQNTRPVLTQNIKEVTEEIKKGIKAIRGYLFEKYEDDKKAVSYYKEFGLEKKGNNWQLPNDQQNMMLALKTIKKGITTHGFGTKKFGTAKFTQLETSYIAIVNSAVSSDGASSMTVSNKEVLKKELKTFMTSIRYMVRAHYPDTYLSVLRDLGFQKEKL